MTEILKPIASQLKYARIFGGFPLSIKNGRLEFSWFQLLKHIILNFICAISLNIFNIYGAWDGKGSFFYQEVFKSVGFIALDFGVGAMIGLTNMTAMSFIFWSAWMSKDDLETVCSNLRDIKTASCSYKVRHSGIRGKMNQAKTGWPLPRKHEKSPNSKSPIYKIAHLQNRPSTKSPNY